MLLPCCCRNAHGRMEAERLPVWRQWLSEPVEPSSAKRRRVEPGSAGAAPGNPAAEKLQVTGANPVESLGIWWDHGWGGDEMGKQVYTYPWMEQGSF